MEIQRSWRGLGSIRCIVERDDLAVFAFQLVINSGVVYKGAFYSDCLLGNFEETAAGCIEVNEFLHIFNLLGDFVCAYRIDSCFGGKEYKKALKKVLKGIK